MIMSYKEAVSIVVRELKLRLPANATEGYMPEPEVVEAMKVVGRKLKDGKKNK